MKISTGVAIGVAILVGLFVFRPAIESNNVAMVTLVMDDGREVVIRAPGNNEGLMQLANQRFDDGSEDAREEAFAILQLLAARGYQPAIEMLAGQN